MKNVTVGLLSNPNAGKTTLFNQLTGARQRVGNWAGVTVERKEGFFTAGSTRVNLIDLPGTYSLTTISQQASIDEQIACHFVLSQQADLLINVVDACNLERNLYLTLQLRELGVPCIVALNMLDMAENQRISIDIPALSQRLGCPVVPVVSTRGSGLDRLKQLIDKGVEAGSPLKVDYPPALDAAADQLAAAMPVSESRQRRRWLALQLLEGDVYSRQQVGEL
ncbi:MAG: FeoB small GTPase domain-containing protein, partial [Mixta calida]|nr:FeoB small GTPase domain-containing protein [Mixta calida]